MGACLASALIALAYLAPLASASDTGDAAKPKKSVGFASIAFEGVPKGVSYYLDTHTLNIPIQEGRNKAGPVVVKSGPHVVEVREGERVLFHEEVTLEPNETRTFRLPKAE
jgi:hypothetical protein